MSEPVMCELCGDEPEFGWLFMDSGGPPHVCMICATSAEVLAILAARTRWYRDAYRKLGETAKAEGMEEALKQIFDAPREGLDSPDRELRWLEWERDKKLKESRRGGVEEHERAKLKAEADQVGEAAALWRDLHRIYLPLLQAADRSKLAEARARFMAAAQEWQGLIRSVVRSADEGSDG